ncbi:hypothetical protein Gogos_020408 [Gossypium gossypioides]|uniref:Retrovirus-related Pol polyprotein from transposon TNT 1-94-like beta-barrel domain-containing protein n=1 Tax=Gossypium gossypioides TaxID=34282 RepID=A0A7J9D0V3_GOSGO|nr:hypothetical protein [Gossypium gossypioides]
MDKTFKDEDLVLMLLGLLPEEFEFLETMLLYEKVSVSLSEIYNMCPRLEWFFDLKELKGGDVYTVNNTPLTTYGIGSVQLRNHDESIITLHDVRYVPDLIKNLISVGTLESKSFKVKAKDVNRTIVVISIENRELKTLKLWHMRLGHGPTARAKVAKADEKTPKSEGATETESIAHFYVVQTLG